MKKKKLAIIFGILVLLLIVGVVLADPIYQKVSHHPEVCGMCHVMDKYVETYNHEGELANTHKEADLVCKDCHKATVTEAMREAFVFVTGDYEFPFKEREKFGSAKSCLGECHDLEDIVEQSAYLKAYNPHDSHLGEMECNMCHKMHKPSVSFCADCHGEGWIPEVP
ncbi:hypothetical protein Dacet_2167 [Denitrovibrio acetiphilus DSM 12809]|uniref:Tetrahaem cytochrome domain-containing protein n=1 Tax=Denitrovibrio acetiphilus (strain DSM 12809 / NBRC 114555 / N2460) TaxID=522772 RepID=D4H2D8_DENA2|nr:cytochrome c3 family protein [Denitrovibrio acetiphilus]ADD68929.1 hypothetical protein Dacet_2167 [Denitrovibrio acetiphilus DSM 12809]